MKQSQKFLLSFLSLFAGLFLFSTSFAIDCTTIRGTTVLNGKSTTGYSLQTATYTTSCASARGILTCNNGSLGGNPNLYKYQSCNQPNRKKCTTPVAANHLEYKTLYSSGNADYYNTCFTLGKSFQCIDGNFVGTNVNSYTFGSCKDQNRKQCIDKRSNSYVNHLGTIFGYTANKSTNTKSCIDLKQTLTCTDGLWNPAQSSLSSTCQDLNIKNCVFTGKDLNNKDIAITINHNSGKWLYSSNIAVYPTTKNQLSGYVSCTNGTRSSSKYMYTDASNGNAADCLFTGKDLNNKDIAITIKHNGSNKLYSSNSSIFPKTCNALSGMVSCNNGKLSTQSYIFTSCSDGNAKACSFTGKDNIVINANHGSKVTLWSTNTTIYPQTCKQFSGDVLCSNGSFDGNIYTYNFSKCTDGKNPNAPTADSSSSKYGIDIALEAGLAGGGSGLPQSSSPSLEVLLINTGSQGLLGSDIKPGFLSCTWEGQTVYATREIDSLIINKGTSVKKTITLSGAITEKEGEKTIICTLKAWNGETNLSNNTKTISLHVEKAGRFDLSLNRAIDPIKNNLDAAELKGGAEGVKDFLINKVMEVLVPIVILLGILIAILGFYKIFFATDDKAIETGTKLIAYGALGIILIMSAKFFAGTISGDIFNNGELGYGDVQGYDIAQKLYEQLFFPFIKIGIYLSLGVLFVMLAARVVTFIFGTDDDTKKKAGTIIIWNVIGMLVIIGSKQLIEFVYGKQADVVKPISNLGEIGSGLLATKNFPFLYQVINWAMGLASLAILIMVLWQAFQLLMKPDAPDAMKKIKNSLLYIFIGILVIGTGYVITNFLIIN